MVLFYHEHGKWWSCSANGGGVPSPTIGPGTQNKLKEWWSNVICWSGHSEGAAPHPTILSLLTKLGGMTKGINRLGEDQVCHASNYHKSAKAVKTKTLTAILRLLNQSRVCKLQRAHAHTCTPVPASEIKRQWLSFSKLETRETMMTRNVLLLFLFCSFLPLPPLLLYVKRTDSKLQDQ